ncbi:MAG TPA: hypothetical protein VKT81_11695 [Bryobacteraceae bacterium]|nr:hypothetical protein [Bryobacteraceae bacterium]
MRRLLAAALFVSSALAQVYSPKVLLNGQPDASDLHALAEDIYTQAHAHTPRERAEAVWRFFLTDGRFVKPGFWYHIAGWAYEEPAGEVLDPLKLLNSYGFGLCYHIAPVLEAVWKAGGFEDARVWFLTGHTVAEVYYDGAYHYYDSDMMGYNAVGRGSPMKLPVASVHQIEQDGNIILSKLKGPKEVDEEAVEAPWYPADVREAAIDGLAELFTTTSDNRLFPFERAPQGHKMSFELRPGERLIRYFAPESAGDYYLPYKFTGNAWEEFPQEIAEYHIKTADGPRSQKDDRMWATGALEYRLPIASDDTQIFEVRSPYVIVDARFEFDAVLAAGKTLTLATSTDDGRTWEEAGVLRGPHHGTWGVEPKVLIRSEHGRRTAVSGKYNYLLRLTKSTGAELRSGLLRTRIQLNPRTLPALAPGHNDLRYTAGPARVRREISSEPFRVTNARYVSDGAQGYWVPAAERSGELLFRMHGPAASVDAGARFLDLSDGLAPDKFTAEVRRVQAISSADAAASIAWSTSADGPFQTLWEYDPHLKWKDGIAIDRVLRWPEVDRHADVSNASEIYVRYQIRGLAVDSFRLALEQSGGPSSSAIAVTHVWKEDHVPKTHTERIAAGAHSHSYSIDIPANAKIENQALIFECK